MKVKIKISLIKSERVYLFGINLEKKFYGKNKEIIKIYSINLVF
jgi:hypothetical protein